MEKTMDTEQETTNSLLKEVLNEIRQTREENKVFRDEILELKKENNKVKTELEETKKKLNILEIRVERCEKEMKLLEINDWFVDKKFDFISCLNVIDRCDTPLKLLHQMRDALTPNGTLLLAVVLPFSAYVEAGTNHKPRELLPISGPNFEDQVKSVIDNVFTPANFEVVSWSRVPYLCEGDLQQSYYWLDDAVFVLKLKDF
uniref:Methyltransferase-like protein 9 n=1 Tax=Diabrotica virgifera virgifera TaxID=50390 RepID=A0A6P7GYT6_DIAVI